MRNRPRPSTTRAPDGTGTRWRWSTSRMRSPRTSTFWSRRTPPTGSTTVTPLTTVTPSGPPPTTADEPPTAAGPATPTDPAAPAGRASPTAAAAAPAAPASTERREVLPAMSPSLRRCRSAVHRPPSRSAGRVSGVVGAGHGVGTPLPQCRRSRRPAARRTSHRRGCIRTRYAGTRVLPVEVHERVSLSRGSARSRTRSVYLFAICPHARCRGPGVRMGPGRRRQPVDVDVGYCE